MSSRRQRAARDRQRAQQKAALFAVRYGTQHTLVWSMNSEGFIRAMRDAREASVQFERANRRAFAAFREFGDALRPWADLQACVDRACGILRQQGYEVDQRMRDQVVRELESLRLTVEIR